jgi:nitronate monooxygenase
MLAGVSADGQLRNLSRWPIVVAPMAGGPSTVGLVVAAAEAGALGFLAGGYKSADAMAAEIDAVRSGTGSAFGVNVFMPGEPAEDRAVLSSYVRSLAEEARALGVSLGPPDWDDDAYAAKFDVLLAQSPPMVSFTFGCPTPEEVRALQAAGTLVALTVTTPEEAMLALRSRPDALCLQGSEAGAHRGHYVNDDRPDQDRPLRSLLASLRRRTRVPLIAAGGIWNPEQVVGALAGGATQVQVGTAFLRCHESGIHPTYRSALGDHRFATTAVSRAFSGRRARALVNQMMLRHAPAPAAYPEINNATRPLRAAAAQAGDPDHMSLYAGVGFRHAEDRSAGEVVEYLVSGLPA